VARTPVHDNLTFRDLAIGVRTLRQYVNASIFGNEWSKFAPGVSDIQAYFPKFIDGCGHCRSSETTFVLFALANRIVSEAASERSRLAIGLAIRELEDCDQQILTFFVIAAVGNQWSSYELGSFGLFALIVQLSASTAGRLQLDYLDTYTKIVDATHPYFETFEPLKYSDTRKILIHQEIWAAIHNDLSDEIEKLQSSRNLRTPARVRILIGERIARFGTQTETRNWASYLFAEAPNSYRAVRQLVQAYTRMGVALDETTKELVLDCLNSADEEHLLIALIEYAERSGDSTFMEEYALRLWDGRAKANYRILHRLLVLWVREGNYTQFEIAFEQQIFLKSIDYEVLDFVERLRGGYLRLVKPAISKLFDYATEHPSEVDFKILLRAVIDKNILDNQFVSEVIDAAAKFASPEPHAENRSVNNSRHLVSVLMDCRSKHPGLAAEVAKELSGSYSQEILFVESIPDSAEELRSSASARFSSSLGEQSRIFYFGFIDYLLREQAIDENRILNVLGWMKAFANVRGDHTPLNSQVRIFITSVARVSDVEQLGLYLRELLDMIDSRVALAVRRVVAILFHENFGDDYARNLAQAARNCGIELDLRASTMQIQQDWLDGKLFDTDTISGVGDEYWGQLSVIFQEVVHELSQPVMAILARIEALNRAGPMGISIDAMDSSLIVLQNYANRIGERLRHYSALAFEGGISKWTDLPALVREIAADTLAHAKAMSVEISIDVSRLGKGRFVFGPPLQLRIAIQNLLRNAINALSAVQRDRRIQVIIHSIKYDFETVFVQISDNGPGIPEELKLNIFEKGFTTKTGHGLGLGLALAASTISSMGGQLKLEQSDSSGSTFLIVLPSGTLEERFNGVQNYDSFNEMNELGQG